MACGPSLRFFSGARVGNQTLGWAGSTTRRWRTIFPMSWIEWASLRRLCRRHRLARQGGRGACGRQPRHGEPRTSVVVVFAWGIVLALGSPGVGGLAEIRRLDRTILFLALSGLATGLCGSATSAPCNSAQPRASPRSTSSASRWSSSSHGSCSAKRRLGRGRWPAHHRRSRGDRSRRPAALPEHVFPILKREKAATIAADSLP